MGSSLASILVCSPEGTYRSFSEKFAGQLFCRRFNSTLANEPVGVEKKKTTEESDGFT